MKEWILQDAKAQFSGLVNDCLTEGPQFVSKHGKPAIVVISQSHYEKLIAPRSTLKDFFRSAPRAELDLTRDKDPGREILL